MKAKDLFGKAFSVPRDPRSPEYKAGCMAALEHGLNGKTTKLPYSIGTAQADAWFAGRDEGMRILRDHGFSVSGRKNQD